MGNDVFAVFVMDGCYCFLTLVISFHFGAACCTVWDCRLFLQRSQFTEESGKLCNDVVAVFVMDVCYCFVDACYFISFWRGLLLLCRFLYCMGLPCHFLYCLGSRTTAAWDLVLLRGILYYRAVSCTRTVWDLVQRGILYSAGSKHESLQICDHEELQHDYNMSL